MRNLAKKNQAQQVAAPPEGKRSSSSKKAAAHFGRSVIATPSNSSSQDLFSFLDEQEQILKSSLRSAVSSQWMDDCGEASSVGFVLGLATSSATLPPQKKVTRNDRVDWMRAGPASSNQRPRSAEQAMKVSKRDQVSALITRAGLGKPIADREFTHVF
jgi:hypothetical protein